MKKAYTIDQQIARLKSNGMMFDNEEKAKEILLDVGYYRLGFYSFPYEIKFPRLEHRDHKLKSGTTFKSVYDFYENPIIQHHHANHSGIYAPAWKTIEFMTIGNIITLYDSLKEPAAKDLVANAYGCSKGVFSITWKPSEFFATSAHTGDASTAWIFPKASNACLLTFLPIADTILKVA